MSEDRGEFVQRSRDLLARLRQSHPLGMDQESEDRMRAQLKARWDSPESLIFSPTNLAELLSRKEFMANVVQAIEKTDQVDEEGEEMYLGREHGFVVEEADEQELFQVSELIAGNEDSINLFMNKGVDEADAEVDVDNVLGRPVLFFHTHPVLIPQLVRMVEGKSTGKRRGLFIGDYFSEADIRTFRIAAHSRGPSVIEALGTINIKDLSKGNLLLVSFRDFNSFESLDAKQSEVGAFRAKRTPGTNLIEYYRGVGLNAVILLVDLKSDTPLGKADIEQAATILTTRT